MNTFRTKDGTTVYFRDGMTRRSGSNNRRRLIGKALPLAVCLSLTGCFPYVYHDQRRVLIDGIDVGATLEIARIELEQGGFDASLTMWAIRDQVVGNDQARRISELYFTHIDRIASDTNTTTAEFGVWHLAWAVSNLYRNGNDGIRRELECAFLDALARPKTLKRFDRIAAEHVDGNKIYMGDIHDFARSFARSHIVAPGNRNYLQSLDEYRKNDTKE